MEAFVIIILSFIGLYILSGIKIVNQYQRGVVLTLGRFTGVREPGLRVVIPVPGGPHNIKLTGSPFLTIRLNNSPSPSK